MSFLAPFFLAAVGAISLPILLHLIRRTPRGKVIFSSLMFLSPTPPRLTKRSSIEHWLLLFLRGLAVVLIALAFARPFFWESATADAQEAGDGRRVAILIDTSGSMQREDLWRQATMAVDAALNEAAPTDEFSLMAFDRSVRRMVSREQWSAAPLPQRAALIKDALASLSPGHGATNLGDALVAAADALNENESTTDERAFTGQRQIVLITDLQEGSHLGPLDGYDWPGQVTVKVAQVKAKAVTNAGLQIVADRETTSDAKDTLRVRVHNARNSERESFTIRFDPLELATESAPGAPASRVTIAPKAIEVYVPPGESRTLRTGDLSLWWSPMGNTISLEGDDHPFDNRVYHSATHPAEVVIVYIGDDAAGDVQGLRFYLELVYAPGRELITRVVTVRPGQSLPPGETDGAALIIVGEATPHTQALRKRAEEGATLLLVARDTGMMRTLADLLPSSPAATGITLTEADVKDYAMLSEIDFKHPLFAPFADPRFSDFTTIRFWKHRRLDAAAIEGSRVLAKFDDGSPALVETPIGKGRCFTLAAGWHPADGQLALSSKFAPLMHVLLRQAMGQPPASSRLVVGDAIDLAWLANSPSYRGKPVTVTGPDQGALMLGEDQRITATDQPGVYRVQVGEEMLRMAVNLPAGESETMPLPAAELEKRGVRLWQSQTVSVEKQEEQKRQMRMTELENRHKIWRWLIVAAIAVLMLETFVAGRFARPAGGGNETAS